MQVRVIITIDTDTKKSTIDAGGLDNIALANLLCQAATGALSLEADQRLLLLNPFGHDFKGIKM